MKKINLFLFMKKLLTLIVCALLMTAFYSCDNNKHTPAITAEIKGLGNDTLYVSYVPLDEHFDDEDMLCDTIVANNDRFQFDLSVNENMLVFINPKSFGDAQQIRLVLEPNKPLTITGQIQDDNYLSYRVEQPSFSADYAIDREVYKTATMKFDSINTEIKLFFSLPKEDQKFAIRYQLNQDLRKQREVIREHRLSYIQNNLDKDLAAYYLIRKPYDSIGVYLPQLTESVVNGMFKAQLEHTRRNYKLIQNAKNLIVVGATAPDFTLKNLEGERISLSSLKGEKHIVLYFWGTWCYPCVKGMPKMKEYYNKYKDKVEFVGIACNDKDADWRRVVNELELPWINLKDNDTGNPIHRVSPRYAVAGYPTKIILDQDLKILAVFLGGGEIFYQKLDRLLK
jgi:thiol-disulfide isomerase/thioredoxin